MAKVKTYNYNGIDFKLDIFELHGVEYVSLKEFGKKLRVLNLNQRVNRMIDKEILSDRRDYMVIHEYGGYHILISFKGLQKVFSTSRTEYSLKVLKWIERMIPC